MEDDDEEDLENQPHCSKKCSEVNDRVNRSRHTEMETIQKIMRRWRQTGDYTQTDLKVMYSRITHLKKPRQQYMAHGVWSEDTEPWSRPVHFPDRSKRRLKTRSGTPMKPAKIKIPESVREETEEGAVGGIDVDEGAVGGMDHEQDETAEEIAAHVIRDILGKVINLHTIQPGPIIASQEIEPVPEINFKAIEPKPIIASEEIQPVPEINLKEIQPSPIINPQEITSEPEIKEENLPEDVEEVEQIGKPEKKERRGLIARIRGLFCCCIKKNEKE